MSNRNVTIAFEYPFPNERVFRYQAMQDVLSVLIDQPYEEFTIGELASLTGADQSAVSKGVALLAKLGTVTRRSEGRKQYVSIDRERLQKPDPILAVPQSEFHKPVRAFVDRLLDDLDDLVGVVLFGSVARGTADRTSDVDLLVIVDDDRTAARRTVQTIVSDLEDTTFDGQRYTFEPLVESVESARRVGDGLREQFDGGLTLVDSERLTDLRRTVFANGA